MINIKILIFIAFCLLFSSKSYSDSKDEDEQRLLQKINLNSTDTINNIPIRYQNIRKGMFRFIWSFPYINSFYLNPHNENTKNNTGFIGCTYGLDYFYKTNRYINFSFSQIIDYYIPLPIRRNYNKIYEGIDSYYICLSNNHKIRRFSLGYGFSIAQNNWGVINNNWDENSSTREPVEKTNYALGLISSFYYQITPIFHFGIVYRPTFLRPDIEPTFKYEHSISIDIGWKIPLGK